MQVSNKFSNLQNYDDALQIMVRNEHIDQQQQKLGTPVKAVTRSNNNKISREADDIIAAEALKLIEEAYEEIFAAHSNSKQMSETESVNIA